MKFIAIVIIVIRIPQRSEKGQTHAQWAKNGKNSAINDIHTSHLNHKSKSTILNFFLYIVANCRLFRTSKFHWNKVLKPVHDAYLNYTLFFSLL